MANSSDYKCFEDLENSFEKGYVALDLIIGDPATFETGENDDEEDEIVGLARDKMLILASSFNQVYHKSLTLTGANAKLEQDNERLREELLQTKARAEAANIESGCLVRRLHAMQISLHSVVKGEHGDFDSLRKKLDTDLEEFWENARNQAYLKEKIALVNQENCELQKQVQMLEQRLHGARLATKYMDKEISGRMQQIQLLRSPERAPNFNQLWDRLESEILYHRQKTVIKSYVESGSKADKKNHPFNGLIRNVIIYKNPDDELGLTIAGGVDHGVTAIITGIAEGSVAERNGGLAVGDSILGINGFDANLLKHREIVDCLTQKVNCLSLFVKYVDADKNNSDDDDDTVLEAEVAGSVAQPVSLQKFMKVRRHFPPEAVNQLQSTAEPIPPSEDPIESDAETPAAPNNGTESTDGLASCSSESAGDHKPEAFISTC